MQLRRAKQCRAASRYTQLRRLSRIGHYRRSCTCSWVISWPVSSGLGPSMALWPTRSARNTLTNDAGTANASESEYTSHFAGRFSKRIRRLVNNHEERLAGSVGSRFMPSTNGNIKVISESVRGLLRAAALLTSPILLGTAERRALTPHFNVSRALEEQFTCSYAGTTVRMNLGSKALVKLYISSCIFLRLLCFLWGTEAVEPRVLVH